MNKRETKSKVNRRNKSFKSEEKMTDKPVKHERRLPIPRKCIFTKTSLIVDESISDEEFMKVGNFLTQVEKSIMWWVGDWCCHGDIHHPCPDVKIKVRKRYSKKTIYNAAWVCHQIEPSRRREKLSFGHHQVVAPLKPEEQDFWLEKAEKERFSVRKLRKEIEIKKSQQSEEDSDLGTTVIDVSGKHHYFYNYVTGCNVIMSQLRNMLIALIDFKKRCSCNFFTPETVKTRQGEKGFLERAENIIQKFELLLGDYLNLNEEE